MRNPVSSDGRCCRARGMERWRKFRPVPALVSLLALAATAAVPAAAQASGPDYVTVSAMPYAARLVAYGQVEPVALAPVAAAETGVVTGLRVMPGSRVRAGEMLARLSGPEISSLLLQSRADVRSAKAQLAAAEQSLAIERQQLPSHLTTRQALHQAESAQAQARTALENAESKLKAVQQMRTLTAPASGIVETLNSADGALVAAGQAVLTLQTNGGLWLRATYYGRDIARIHAGLRGSFAPTDGSRAIGVRVVSVPGTMTAGGGESIALEPTDRHFSWLNGEAGTVTLKLPAKRMVEVPTRALVVNQGKWWVLVHTAKGNHPQQVVPGPAEGWNTWIESGLAAGTEVVVKNAYLLYHAGVAEQYQIPD